MSMRKTLLAALCGLATLSPAHAAMQALDLIMLVRQPDALLHFIPAAIGPDEAAAILAAPPGQPLIYVLRDAQEAARIAAEKGVVARAGKTLTLQAGGKKLEFTDRKVPATADREGDGQRYTFAGRLGSNGYLRVTVEEEHDAPASLLIDPNSGRAVKIYDGGDENLLSPDGQRLIALRQPGPPAAFAVVRLAAGGPVVELLCSTPEKRYSEPNQVGAELGRWRDADTVELRLRPGKKEEGGPLALRLRREGEKWIVAVADPERLATAGGLRCR